MKTLVNYEGAHSNAKSFITELKQSEMLQRLLSQFRHWYYFEDTKSFAPSKYIGYQNNSAKVYEKNYNKGADGRVTEAVLKKFFRITSKVESEILYQELDDFLETYKKKPNKNTIIHVRK